MQDPGGVLAAVRGRASVHRAEIVRGHGRRGAGRAGVGEAAAGAGLPTHQHRRPDPGGRDRVRDVGKRGESHDGVLPGRYRSGRRGGEAHKGIQQLRVRAAPGGAGGALLRARAIRTGERGGRTKRAEGVRGSGSEGPSGRELAVDANGRLRYRGTGRERFGPRAEEDAGGWGVYARIRKDEGDGGKNYSGGAWQVFRGDVRCGTAPGVRRTGQSLPTKHCQELAANEAIWTRPYGAEFHAHHKHCPRHGARRPSATGQKSRRRR
mmetsp:Transcript_21578/g.54482  ORF Transcript_21578/g.54482 Transcript_21578/m.54482 type:complete len:265 (+) Transcript_21578:1498-2292(+)